MSSDEVGKLLQQLNPRKAIGDDKIHPALIKIAAKPLSTPLSKAINNSFKHNFFPNNAKVAYVKPLEIDIEMLLSPFLAAYKKSCNTQFVLIKMIEVWRENLDNSFFVGAVLTNFPKASDYIPHDLLIAKLSAYGLSSDSLCYIYSYLKDLKQCVQIKNKSQGSIFGPILLNIFLNDFFFFIPKAPVHNFSGDNTLCSFVKTLKGLITILQSEYETTINWLFTTTK